MGTMAILKALKRVISNVKSLIFLRIRILERIRDILSNCIQSSLTLTPHRKRGQEKSVPESGEGKVTESEPSRRFHEQPKHESAIHTTREVEHLDQKIRRANYVKRQVSPPCINACINACIERRHLGEQVLLDARDDQQHNIYYSININNNIY